MFGESRPDFLVVKEPYLASLDMDKTWEINEGLLYRIIYNSINLSLQVKNDDLKYNYLS
jgi:hypothetical protein